MTIRINPNERSILVICLASVVAWLCMSATPAASTEVGDRFAVEAEAMWAELRLALFDASYRGRNRAMLGGVQEEYRFENLRHRYGALTRTIDTTSGRETVAGQNRHYRFRISRHIDHNDWRIDTIELAPPGARFSFSPTLEQDPTDGTLEWHVRSPFVHGVPAGEMPLNPGLGNFFQLPGLEVRNVVEAIREEQRVVEISYVFTYIGPHSSRGQSSYQASGELVVLPDRMWCVAEHSYTVDWRNGSKTTFAVQIHYDFESDRIPLMRSKTLQRVHDGQLMDEQVIEIQMRYRDFIRPSEATLSAFNLPEPAGVRSGLRVPIAIWVLVAATLLIGMGSLVRHMARKSSG